MRPGGDMITLAPRGRLAIAAGAALALAIVGVAAWAFHAYDLKAYMNEETVRAVISPLGPWAPLAFVALFVAVVLFSLPSIAMTIAGGALFGFWGGLALSLIGINVGTGLAFLLARRFGRAWVEGRFGERLQRLADYLSKHGFATIFFIRFSGVVPLAVTNYAAGLSRLTGRDYVLGTFLGLTPGMAVYTYLGASLATFQLGPIALALGLLGAMAIGAYLYRRRRGG